MAEPKRRTVGILLFDQIEMLDWAGPYEVFAGARDEGEQPYFRVLTVAERPQVQVVGGVRIVADATFGACPDLDVLVVPGGPGARNPEGQAEMLRFVRDTHERVELTASVCTGAFILARAGLLAGHKATTHTRRFELFRSEFPAIELQAVKVVDEGRVVTAGGVSSGIDLALHLLARWYGPEARRREAQLLDGPWE